ncbi:uncharacterized protein LOC124268909 [Haliotis rubra]|uniref:uncharacterized protein LOC124268909 n=1 Tax=Haliotis rubra TaxID=36100 RepID=UPI001EE5E616|nr:uncharacterized protein LOC124268909 [Haliotis rubra]
MKTMLYLLLFVLLPVTLASNGGADLTLTAGTGGSVVVNAAVDRIRSNCILGDDRLFLRRLAYVETTDGEDPDTYRPGYDGGLWQIDEDKFLETTSCASSISAECASIQSAFKIDWRSTSWADLRKPLYSGLAAALYIKKYNSRSLPGDVTSQATFWASNLRPGGSMDDFIAKAKGLKGIDCGTQLDLAFILDGSGSVSTSDFRRMLDFIADIVSELDISEDGVKVSTVEYASNVGGDILFKSFTTKDSLLNSISTIRKSGGGTNTAAAILHTVDVLFSPAAGARPNAKRVAILLTDGRSSSKTATISAASKAKDDRITMISVGIGNIDESELKAVATEPDCTHVIILNDFTEIDSLLYQLKDSSCGAPTVVDKVTPIVTPLPVNITVDDSFVVEEDPATPDDGDDEVIVGEVICGTLAMYASYSTPRPGPAFYDSKDSASDGKPGVIYFNKAMKGRPLYITVIGSRLPLTVDQMPSCINASFSVGISQLPSKVEVICREGLIERECTKDDLEDNGFSCDESSNVSNPCSPGNICDHAHPSDSTKFIHCDSQGNMYVTQCPGKTQYNPGTVSCGAEPVQGGVSCDVSNPCTPKNIANGKFYFPYPPNPSKYIQCDTFGKSWIRDCPADLVWNSALNTCYYSTGSAQQPAQEPAKEPSGHTTSVSPPAATTDANPCNSNNNGQIFPHTDRTKYITCTNNGVVVVQSCAPPLVYDDTIKTCNWA